MGPCPIAFNEVGSVAELARELQLGHSIMHVRAANLAEIWSAGLRWDDQYDYMPVYVAPMSLKVWAFGISETSADGSPVGPGMRPSDRDVFYGSPTRVQAVGNARFIRYVLPNLRWHSHSHLTYEWRTVLLEPATAL